MDNPGVIFFRALASFGLDKIVYFILSMVAWVILSAGIAWLLRGPLQSKIKVKAFQNNSYKGYLGLVWGNFFFGVPLIIFFMIIVFVVFIFITMVIGIDIHVFDKYLTWTYIFGAYLILTPIMVTIQIWRYVFVEEKEEQTYTM